MAASAAGKPRAMHTTVASSMPQPLSQKVPQRPAWNSSTRPRVTSAPGALAAVLPATRRISPSADAAENWSAQRTTRNRRRLMV